MVLVGLYRAEPAPFGVLHGGPLGVSGIFQPMTNDECPSCGGTNVQKTGVGHAIASDDTKWSASCPDCDAKLWTSNSLPGWHRRLDDVE